ncbi:hypothetical protein ACIQW9_01110 [Herminiimonas sp. NPDC097707]|uniref:hypothetical protein n=1 Tax=Herminiimonas sp. NPDC097707 TaxID=3364007 RepID=UPI003839E2D8
MSAKNKEIQALRDAALEDLLVISDEELRLEAKDAGEDLDKLANEMKAAMREAAAGALRQRMQQAKVRTLPTAKPVNSLRKDINIEFIKAAIQSLFAQDPRIGLAFRDGKKQTDSDWLSLYDDLIALGAIKPSDDEH